jgi:transporter family-2 protein
MHPALVALIALAGGVAAGLQAQLVSFLGQRIGTVGSVFITHLGGAVIALALLMISKTGSLASWRGVPWYVLVGTGALGVALLSAFSFTIPRLGVAATLTLVVMAQLTIGAIADHFGFLGVPVRLLDPARIAGIAVLMVGTWLVVR